MSRMARSGLCRDCYCKSRRLTHCKRGHEFTPENIIWQWNNKCGLSVRTCRACRRERGRLRSASVRLTPNRLEYYKEWCRNNADRMDDYRRKWEQNHPKLCLGCSAKVAYRAKLCRHCNHLAYIFRSISRGNNGPMSPLTGDVIKHISNPQLQRSFQCQKQLKQKLKKVRQLINQPHRQAA